MDRGSARAAMQWPKGSASFGIGLRRPHFDELIANREDVEFIEVISENFMGFGGRPRAVLDSYRDRMPVIAHGVGLSIAGPDPLNEEYLRVLRAFVDELDPPWYSDHLSYTSGFGVEYHDLIPFPFREDALAHVAERVARLQDLLGRPFLLENSSYYAAFPSSEMSEAEFFCELMARTGCGMLLDINNVYVNARNHGYDPRAFITSLPRDRVLQYHMAGHDASGPILIDTHGAHIIEPVFELYAFALEAVGPAWTVVEWDNDIPALDVYLEENRRVRRAAARVLGPDVLPRAERERGGSR